MESQETSPLLGNEEAISPTIHGTSAINPVVPNSYQNPSSDDDVLAVSREDVVDGRRHHTFRETPNEGELRLKSKTYPRRFWILGVFSFIALFQCLQWNTWGPISASVNAAYSGWGSGTVAMMANWGTITFVIFVAPMCWLMNTKGLRAGVFCCAVLIATGTVLRILAFIGDSTEFFTVMCHLCAILVGTSGTLVMAAPPMIAAEWFPPKERTTATAIAQVFNQMGNGFSYLEPLIVRSPSDVSPAEIREDIKVLMYIYAAIGVAVLLIVYIYYPSKPPSPPSLSSTVERLQFWESLKKMFRNRDLILVTLSYGISVGVPSAWIAVLNYSLQAINIHQDDAMWIGLAAVICSSISGLIAARLTDVVYGHIRMSLILNMTATLACFYWFYLIAGGSIPVVRWQVYATVVGGMSLNFLTCPLFFELAVETAYPCPEILVGGLLTGVNNLMGLIFLFIFLIPNIGYNWVTYLLLATSSLSILPLCFVKEEYARSSMDRDTGLHSSYQPI